MKCDSCNGCRKPKWIDNKVYFVCLLCKRIWRAGNIDEVLGEEKEELLDKLNLKVIE
jgi:hypothetical protein